MHLLAHLDAPVVIAGRTSALKVAPDADCIVPGELIHDSDLRGRKLIYVPGHKVTSDPTKSFTVEFETIIQLPGGEWSDICEDPAVTHRWLFLPRTCNCGDACPCADAPCRCHDKADLGGGFIYMGHTTVRGAAKTPHVQPVSLAATGGMFRQQGWRDGDELYFPATVPGEQAETVRIDVGEPGLTTITEAIEVTKPWSFPAGVTSATFEIVDGKLTATFQAEASKITFRSPLKFSHRHTDGRLASVANLTRNIVFRSAETGKNWQRGHVMGMHAPPSDWSYYEVRGMGRTRADVPITKIKLNPNGTVASADYTNPVGRYSEHFGHWRTGGNDQPTTRTGGVIRDFLKWGGANHGGNVIVKDFVSIDGDGSCFAAENGNERGGFYNCFAAGAHGPPGHRLRELRQQGRLDIQDFGWEGSGAWLQNGGMEVVGGHIYDCNESVSGYARPLSEIAANPYKTAWLRDSAFKADLIRKGKTVLSNNAVAYRVVDANAANCVRGIGLSFHEGGEPSLIRNCRIEANQRCIDGHYMFAGLIVEKCDLRAPYGSFQANNMGRGWQYLDNQIHGSIRGLDDTGGGDITFKGNVFHLKAPDITLIRGNPTFPRKINGIPWGPEATAAVRSANKRADGSPLVVEGP